MFRNTPINFKRGFTLIELLVVIAIIGVLSSVVLAALNNARAKAANSAIKSNLANVARQAAISYDSANPNSYSGPNVCSNDSSGVPRILAAIDNITTHTCNAVTASYAVQAPLKIDEGSYHFWCVDSAGANRGNTAAQTLGGSTQCP